MKAVVMRKLLEHFAQMHEEAGDEGGAKGLRALAKSATPERTASDS